MSQTENQVQNTTDPTVADVLGKVNETLGAMQDAEQTAVEAVAALAEHIKDPEAHGAGLKENIAAEIPLPVWEGTSLKFQKTDGTVVTEAVELRGPQGEPGPKGDTGEAGPQGEPGPPGKDGADATFTPGTGLEMLDGEVTVKYGTEEGTAAQGNDVRLAAAEDWNASKPDIMSRLASLEGAEPCLPLSGGTVRGDVSVTGILTAGSIYNAVWNDYAEFFPRATEGEGYAETVSGDIIAFDAEASAREGRDVYRAAREGDICLAGVHSDSFGHLVGGEIPPEGKDFFAWNIGKFIPVGLAGRVWCRMAKAEELDVAALGRRVTPSVEPGAGRLWREGDAPSAVAGFIVRLPDAEHPGRVLLALRPI